MIDFLLKYSEKYRELKKALLHEQKKCVKLKEDYDTLDLGFQFNERAMSEMMSNLADIPHIDKFYKKQLLQARLDRSFIPTKNSQGLDEKNGEINYLYAFVNQLKQHKSKPKD